MSRIDKSHQPPWYWLFCIFVVLGLLVWRLLYLSGHPKLPRPDPMAQDLVIALLIVLFVTIVFGIIRFSRWYCAGCPK